METQVLPRTPVEYVVAAAAPDLSRDRAELLVRYCHWSFALDDRIDAGPNLPPGAPSAEALTHELASIVARFRTLDPGGDLLRRFRSALSDGVSAGMAQMRLSRAVATGRCQAPTAEAYLELAGRSVNYRSFAWALLLVLGEQPARLDAVRIDAALAPGSRAVRLANDLRTTDRDHWEGGLNVLLLRSQSGQPATPQWIERQLEYQADHHDTVLAPLAHTRAGDALQRGLRAAIQAYRIADLRVMP